jgi:hypothetical protein
MKSWLYGSNVPSEFLIYSLKALRNDFVWIIYEAAADAGHPGSHETAAFSPAVHTFSVKGYLGVVFI